MRRVTPNRQARWDVDTCGDTILIKRAAVYLIDTGDAPIILLWQPRSQGGRSPAGEWLNASTETCNPLGKACVLKGRHLL